MASSNRGGRDREGVLPLERYQDGAGDRQRLKAQCLELSAPVPSLTLVGFVRRCRDDATVLTQE
jgi:hypothetical protein